MVVHRGAFRVAANLSGTPATLPVPAGEVVLATGEVTREVDGLTVAPRSAAIVRVSETRSAR